MSRDGSVDVKVPDLGDFKDVDVIDVLVKAGDTVAVETPLITLETEKATMDVPSPAAGVIAEVTVRTGDRVNTGSVIARLRSAEQATADARGSSRKDETAPHQALRESEPYGGEPYMDTVPIAPMDNAKEPAAAQASPDAAAPASETTPASKPAPRPRSHRWRTTSISSCSAPGRAATPPRFAPPIWVSRSRWSSAGRSSAVCV